MAYASTDPQTPAAGTTPTVAPGKTAVGETPNVPDVEEQFNVWLDRFLWLSEPLQRGEYDRLAAKKAAGETLTRLEEMQLGFASDQLGITEIPEAFKPGEPRVAVTEVEEVAIVSRPKSRVMPFLVGMGGLAIAAAMITRKRGR